MMLLKSGVSQNPIACSKRSAARTDVILSVLRLPELINQELYTVGGGPHEAEASQMAHLLPFDVVNALRQVD